jgi:hypothetical protein
MPFAVRFLHLPRRGEASLPRLDVAIDSARTKRARQEQLTPRGTRAPDGAIIDAEARIVFDVNEPIDTRPIFNTLDAAAPPTTSRRPNSAAISPRRAAIPLPWIWLTAAAFSRVWQSSR